MTKITSQVKILSKFLLAVNGETAEPLRAFDVLAENVGLVSVTN